MEPINRGKGVTDSERYLTYLADRTFLKLWNYPNTFTDRRRHGEIGKELCDLLVVCGNDIIIFSDKSISWPQSGNAALDWSRWYRKAIKKSVDQIRGAERWLRLFPSRIFLDPKCTQKLPISIPENEQCRVHGIEIVFGAEAACSKFYNGEKRSLIVLPHLKGEAHTDTTKAGYIPFALGDVDPDGPFVHVFDETALDLIMRELDTVSDFVDYLQEREEAIREEKFYASASEAEMIAVYMQTPTSLNHS